MKYYDLIHEDDQWALGQPELPGAQYGQPFHDYDIWAFSNCKPVSGVPIPTPFVILNPGRVVDYNGTIVAGPIVVSKRCGNVIRTTMDSEKYELIPAVIEGHDGDWEVLNILDCVDCLDHTRSKIRYHDLDHPRKPGGPRSVERMIIDPERAAGHELFRLKDWMVAVIASERLKSIFEKEQISGVEFWPVC